MAENSYCIADGFPGGFMRWMDGYRCFVFSTTTNGSLYVTWSWFIESGESWGGRGGENVTRHAEGVAFNHEGADEKITEWVENHH